MSKRNKGSKAPILRPSGKSEGLLVIITVIFISYIMMAYAEQPSMRLKTYQIKPISFKCYEAPSDVDKARIFFCEYGKKANVAYPQLKENIIHDPSAIIKKCEEALSQNIHKILKAEAENQPVKDYLTFKSKIQPFNKDDFLRVVTDPAERTVQKEPNTDKIIAEFRSKEFEIDKNTAFSVYITFVCGQQKEDLIEVRDIILSAVKFESQG